MNSFHVSDAAQAPLAAEIAKLRIENANLDTQLQAAKNIGTFTLTAGDISALGSSIASAVAPTPKTKMEAVVPAKFEGKPDQVNPFLSAARLYFALKPDAFSTEKQKVLWLLQLFTGLAEPWTRAKVDSILGGTSVYALYSDLEDDVRISFSNVSRGEEARNNLQNMKYSSKEGLGAFINRFRPEADASKFDDSTLIYFFHRAIPENVQVQLITMNNCKVPEKIAEWYAGCQLLDTVKASAHHISQSTPTSAPRSDIADVVGNAVKEALERAKKEGFTEGQQ